jgi:hypothetical protein
MMMVERFDDPVYDEQMGSQTLRPNRLVAALAGLVAYAAAALVLWKIVTRIFSQSTGRGSLSAKPCSQTVVNYEQREMVKA